MLNINDYGIIGDGITDFTDQINDLFEQNPGETVFFPNGTYLINTDKNGIKPQSGTTILMTPGAILRAMPTARNNYSIVLCYKVEDVDIAGGIIAGERDRHLDDAAGYFGAGVKVWRSQNISIKDIAISQVWGDGIFVGSSGPVGEITGPTTIENVFLYGNVRAGLSATYVSGLHVKESSFCGNYGTGWGSGISIEPDAETGTSADDLVFERIVCAHNEGFGFRATGSHNPINGLKINDLRSHHNGLYGMRLYYEIHDLILGKLDVHDNSLGDIRFVNLTSEFYIHGLDSQ